MALTPEQKIRLIEAYEPILYFHPDERFGPVKPEAYIQASALWCVQPAGKEFRHKKENWDRCKGDVEFPRKPLIPKNGIGLNLADDTEGTVDTDGDGVNEFYLGHRTSDGFLPYLVSNDDQYGLWFDLAAWQDSQEVTDTSQNKSCNVDGAITRWKDEPELQAAGDWYYAEVEDLSSLQGILATLQEEDGLSLGQVIRDLIGEAVFVWYYFLYPIHEEDLRDCRDKGDADSHGNYEGDWNAVGIIAKPTLIGNRPTDPEFIGFGRWVRGMPEPLEQQMEVEPWGGGAVRHLDFHTKVFVAKGSHNEYAIPGSASPPGLNLGDVACGAVDKVEEGIEKVKDEVADIKDTIRDLTVMIAKVAVGCAIAGPLGCLIGAIAGAIEAAASGGDGDSAPVDDSVQDQMEPDQPPNQDSYGLVLRPSDRAFVLDDADKAVEVRPWKETPDKHLVNRDTQIWWPPEGRDPHGYAGRWGVMCQEDQFDRRSGIEFPNFKLAFLRGLATGLSR